MVQLQCNPPGGNPPPIVAWRKNGVDIKTDARVQTENVFGSYHYLRINEALQKDTGNYTCVAKNKVGERVSRPAFLRVLGELYVLQRITLGPVRTAPFLYKNGEKNIRFCESVHTDPYKNATKTEVFENAIKMDIHKNGGS